MRTLLCGICCCIGLAACTVAPHFKPDASVTTPAVGRPSPPSSVQAAVSGEAFTAYSDLGETSDDGLAPSESFSDLSKDCLNDAGYSNASRFGPGFAFVQTLQVSRPYGAWGYLGSAEDGFSVGSLWNVYAVPGATASGVSGAEQKAMNKCLTIIGNFTNAQLSGPLAGIQTLTNDIQADVQRDPSVKAATKAWSACMAQNGYSLTDPQTAFIKALQAGGAAVQYRSGSVVQISGAPAGSGSAGSGSAGSGSASPGSAGSGSASKAQNPAQIALAVTDAECTESTDLAGIYFAVQASYEQQIVDLNQQALSAAVIEFRNAYQKELTQLPKSVG